MVLATFWAIFSQAHLVTLQPLQKEDGFYIIGIFCAFYRFSLTRSVSH
jgi:hypothetical protein